MGKRMDADRTKLAVRVAHVGYRSAKQTAELVGGERGAEIEQGAKARTREILEVIEEEGTDADDEKAAARRELDGHSRQAFQIEERSPTTRR
jgi:hypothetical protein